MTKVKQEEDSHSHLHSRINEHESKLIRVETILERVALNQDSMAESLKAITKSIGKQELILEKLAHLEENTKGSINRLHRRADENKVEISTKADLATVETMKADLKILEPVTLFAKYPKLFVFTLVGVYVFSIKEFRDAIFGGP